jgi:hypothetical protein
LLQLKRRLWSGFALPTPALQPLILVDARPLIVVVAGHFPNIWSQAAVRSRFVSSARCADADRAPDFTDN